MDLEMESMYFNSIWELVDLPEGPEGFITQGQKQKVCKLIRSIYGLKQASRSWNIRFDIAIKSYGFDQNVYESCEINIGIGVHLEWGVVVWRSIKQGCIADSTMEAEYVAACEAAKEAVWLRKFLYDLEVVPNMNFPITLYCDNSETVANSKEPFSHRKRKHIKRKYHLIREMCTLRRLFRSLQSTTLSIHLRRLSRLKCSRVIYKV
ncbi:gag/pol protein [Cucumis melo var. makuwa]|uniref:Gag/pol protein n=1 Tax=Cucumis melo var. makuwa TaxID=1194695 RepID=A0A5D3BSJ9_CUCMM|nr:gag/pol protein [Cucumis melo var. makuwa]